MTEYNVRVSIIIPHWNGIDILSEPFMLIASEIVIAKLHSIIAKKDPRLSN